MNSDNKNKSTWSVVKELSGGQAKATKFIINHESERVDDPIKVANLFNSFLKMLR